MTTTDFEKSLRTRIGSVIQGNVLPLIELVQSVDPQSLAESDLSKREAYLNRFVDKKFPEHPDLPDFVRSLLQIYYQYWWSVLMQIDNIETAEDDLCKALHALLVKYEQVDTDEQSIDKLEEMVIKNVESLGLWILMDVTRPYRECMIWKSQTRKQFKVNLHDTNSSVDVVFLDDFVSYGWIGFAAFNKIHTGGWAKTDVIYRVGAPPEDEADERFYIDILCHEGRHFSDYMYFPKLQQPELEYRAKLTELCYAKETLSQRIQHLINSSSSDKDSAPHTFSAYCVMRDLSLALFSESTPPSIEEWSALDVDDIHVAATYILDQNSSWLKNNHPEEIETFLDVFEFQPNTTNIETN